MITKPVRRSDGLLSAEGFSALLDKVPSAPRDLMDFVDAFFMHGFGSKSRTMNSLQIMAEMGLLKVDASRVSLTKAGVSLDGTFENTRDMIGSFYCSLLEELHFGSLFQFEPKTKSVLVDSVRLPFWEAGLPCLLADFGVLEKRMGRAWKVADAFVDRFVHVLKLANARQSSANPVSPEALERWLENCRKAGREAEAFAMTFELHRLEGHPFSSQIRWVSEEDASRGFDIFSFHDMRSLTLDRSIEVKGYLGKRRFHWSAGEIAAAKKHRQSYWLYLVDRARISEPGYVPEMYSDPYSYFVETNPEGWESEPTSFLFSAPHRHDKED